MRLELPRRYTWPVAGRTSIPRAVSPASRPVMTTTDRGVDGVLVSKVTIWLAFDSPKAVIAAAGVGTTPRKQVRIAASSQRARSRTGGMEEQVVAMATPTERHGARICDGSAGLAGDDCGPYVSGVAVAALPA